MQKKKGKRNLLKRRPIVTGPELPEGKGPSQGPSKSQRPSGGTPEGGQAKRPRLTVQLTYARAVWECTGLPGKLVSIQRAIDGIVDDLPEEGYTPSLIDAYWTKGTAMW